MPALRILYGLLVAFFNLIMLHEEWLKWYGVHAFLSLDTIHKFSVGQHMSLFEIMHADRFSAVNITLLGVFGLHGVPDVPGL